MTVDTVYLDYAAATPLDERVRDAMEPYFFKYFYNPSSSYEPAVEVRREYEAAKQRLAQTFGAKGDDIAITAGATESINLAILNSKGHIVTSAIEHSAVLEAAQHHEHTIVKPTEKGIIKPEVVAAEIKPTTTLVSVQLANNEIGTIQPLREIAGVINAEKKRRREAGETIPLAFHTDASQGFGYIDVHVARLGVDMLTLNSGKIYGPKQVGLLWIKPGVTVTPQIVGGGQEHGLRSGTENVAGVIGFSKAAEIAVRKQKTESRRLASLRDMLEKKIKTEFSDAICSGHIKKRLPNSLHLSFPNLDGERLVFLLETKGVLVATGSACAANKGTRSHVLTAIGLTPEVADGSLRMTLGRDTTERSISQAATCIIEAVKQEQKRMNRG